MMISNYRPAIFAGRSLAESLGRALEPLRDHVFGLLIDGVIDRRNFLSAGTRCALREALAAASGQRMAAAEPQIERIVSRTLEFAEFMPLFPRRCEGLFEVQADCVGKELFDQACTTFQDGLLLANRPPWDRRLHEIMVTLRDRVDAMKVDALRLIELLHEAHEFERAQMSVAALQVAERRIESIVAGIPELEPKRVAIAKATLDATTAALARIENREFTLAEPELVCWSGLKSLKSALLTRCSEILIARCTLLEQ